VRGVPRNSLNLSENTAAGGITPNFHRHAALNPPTEEQVIIVGSFSRDLRF
jgi:hypothetical protein